MITILIFALLYLSVISGYYRYVSWYPSLTTKNKVLVLKMTQIHEKVDKNIIAKKFPYGISSFELIVSDNFFYVDKSRAIQDLENFGQYVKLWRPRRSGKSLFCSQLSIYYDILVPNEEFKGLFSETYIGNKPTEDRGKYLVLYLSLNSVGTGKDVETRFRNYINNKISSFSKKYKEILKEQIPIDPMDHLSSFQRLLGAVEQSGHEIYLIVDEYDSFANRLLLDIDTTNNDLGRAQYRNTVAVAESLLRELGNVLKTGTAMGVIKRMFFTGVTPMAFSDGLSSLDIVQDASDSTCFESTFGFTGDEVKEALEIICTDHKDKDELDKHFNVIDDNFKGFRYNKYQEEAVFNTQMCLYYLKQLQMRGKAPEKLLDPNIATPGDNVAQYLLQNYRGTRKAYSICNFVFGSFDDKVTCAFVSQSLFDMSRVDDALASLAFSHGYLTYADPKGDERGRLVSPNAVFKIILLDSLQKKYPEEISRDITSLTTVELKEGKDKFLKMVATTAPDKLSEMTAQEFAKKFFNPF